MVKATEPPGVRCQVPASALYRQVFVDSCCPERGLVVEVDGGQHLAQEESDLQRTAFLLRRGYRMLRFWDNDVLLNADVVMEEIARAVEDPHPNPLPKRERAKTL